MATATCACGDTSTPTCTPTPIPTPLEPGGCGLVCDGRPCQNGPCRYGEVIERQFGYCTDSRTGGCGCQAFECGGECRLDVDPVTSPLIGNIGVVTGVAAYYGQYYPQTIFVSVTGGAQPVYGAVAGEDGGFAVLVPLKDGVNSLTVDAQTDGFCGPPCFCRSVKRHDVSGAPLDICGCASPPCECTAATPTPTPTPTPSRTPDAVLRVALQVVEAAAGGTCVSELGGAAPIDIQCGPNSCRFDCELEDGTRGGASLARYTSRFTADYFFRQYLDGAVTEDDDGFSSSLWANVSGRHGRLHKSCWIAEASGDGSASSLLAAEPSTVIEHIREAGLQLGLFSLCPDLPAPVEAAGALLDSFDNYAYCPISPLQCDALGCGMSCTYGPGHESTLSIRWFESVSEAEQSFAQQSAQADRAIEDFHGFPAVFWSTDRPDIHFTDEEYTSGVWRAGCWVVAIASFDDTGIRSAPIPRIVSESIYQGGVAVGLFTTCRP